MMQCQCSTHQLFTGILFVSQATKDPYYLEVGKHVVETLEEHAKVECGFAAIKDLRTFAHEDKY